MPRKQMITVTCQYRRCNQDLAYGPPGGYPQRSPPKLSGEYTLHGVPKRLHCRPRIPVTPSKLSENHARCGQSPRLLNEIHWDSEENAIWSEMKMNFQHSQERQEMNDLVIVPGQLHSLYASEIDSVANCNLQLEVSADKIETRCHQNIILNNNVCQHLDGNNQHTETFSEHGNTDGFGAKNYTPPNSPVSDIESVGGLSPTVFNFSPENQSPKNEINVIDENTLGENLDNPNEEPESWYYKLVQLELQNKTLQVPKPENNSKNDLPVVYKLQPTLPFFPPDEMREIRRISHTEKHVQCLMMRENSIKAREKLKQAQNTRKPSSQPTALGILAISPDSV